MSGLNEFSTIVSLVFGLLVGLMLGSWVNRRLNAGTLEVAAEKLKAELAAELAAAKERAGRVPLLEADLNQAKAQEQDAQTRILQLSTSEAEKARELRGLGERLAELVQESESATTHGQELTQALAQSQAKCAGLQVDNQRIAPLAQQVTRLEQENSHFQTQLATLREDVGRVHAELQAEKDAHTLVRNESIQSNAKLDSELTMATARITQLSQALGDAQSQCAALQADNQRIAPLAEQVTKLENDNIGLMRSLAGLREDVGRAQTALAAEKDAHALVLSNATQLREQLDRALSENSGQQSQLTELTTRLATERKQSEEKLALLLEAKDALSNQFKSLANDILEEKSKRFTEQNRNNLGQLLDPLKTRLQEFQGKIELFYDTEGKQRSALAQQVGQLMDLNKTLSDDAKNLTLALKGSSKSQGNWGELILERVLEASGLRKGEEYDVQESHTRDDGTRAQPDVVIHLPEERHLVVDAKVSLTAYEEYASAESDAERQIAQRRHLDSIRNHIKGLSERNYQALYGLQSLDFVLMFVPIEPAFMLGVTQDNKLFMDAWSRNVLLVSPSTLLFVVRTVAHLWRQEAQNRNAQDIAKRGGELYDRFVAFVTDLEKIGDRLRQAKESYEEAFAKLSTNKGNVIRQAEMLKELGVKPSKAIPRPLLEAAGATHEE